MRELTWFESGSALRDSDITNAQVKLGVIFPPEYIQVLKEHSGASNPDECEFYYKDGERTGIGNFGLLLGVTASDEENIFAVIENLGNQLPAKIVPIISSGSGDFVCFDYRSNPSKPIVVYFLHERQGESCILKVANTFSEFLGMLHEPND